MIRYKDCGERCDRGYGLIEHCWDQRRYTTAPIPLNWVIRWAKSLWFSLMAPRRQTARERMAANIHDMVAKQTEGRVRQAFNYEKTRLEKLVADKTVPKYFADAIIERILDVCDDISPGFKHKA